MKIMKSLIMLETGFLLVVGVNSVALPQSGETLTLKGKISGEYRSNITRQPGPLKDNDIRLSVFLHLDKQWQISGHRLIAVTYDLQHYRYGEFREFTRYDQTLSGQFRQNLGPRFKLMASDELRFRLHPSYGAFNYRRNILNFVLKMKRAGFNTVSIGYQNWLKSYSNDPSLREYVSNRLYLKFGHEIHRGTNFGAKFEYQNHKGNLYVGSTAPDQPLNNRGDRYVFRLNLEKVFSRRFISNVSYRYELDNADGFSLDQSGENFDDEDSEDILAEDSDFGYRKHQGSLSVLFRANARFSFLLFYQVYTKGFQYWLIAPEGPQRQDKLIFLSHKIRFKLSKRIGIDVRYDFETNRTNLHPYQYQINSTSVGLNITP